MFVSEWPEKIILKDGKEIPDTDPSFPELKQQFLNTEKHTKEWVLISTNPNSVEANKN